MPTIVEVPNYGKVEFPDGMSDSDIEAAIKKNAMGYKKPYDVPPGVASAMNVGQGLTFGFGDELAGLVGLDKERYRATVDQFRKDYPGSALLGTVSSSLLPSGVAGKLAGGGAKGLQFLRDMSPWGAAATTGAFNGVLQAAGDAPTLGEVPKEASTGMLLGMVGGPAMMGGGKVLGAAAGAGFKAAASRIPGLSDTLIPILARNRVVTALGRDKIDAEAVPGLLSDLGPEARIADLGAGTRGLLDVNATLPGETKNAVEQVIRSRIAGRPERLDPIVDSVSGGQGRAGQVWQTWQAQKERAAAPLYTRLYSTDVPTTPELRSMLEAANTLGAFREGSTIATARQMPFTLDPMQQNVAMRDLDNVKRGMDQLIQKETRPDGTLTPRGTAYLELQRKYVGTLDSLTADPNQGGASIYKQARDAYAGPAAMQDALSRGRRFLGMDAEGLGITMDGLSSAERDAFRVGAAEALRTKFGTQSGQTEMLNAWKNRNIRERLQTLFDNPAKLNDALHLLDNEAVLKKLETVGQGSQTASRLQAAEDQTQGVAKDLLDLGVKAKTGGLSSLLGSVGRYSAQLGTPEPVRDAIGRILLGGATPAEHAALIKAQQAARARGVTGGLLSGESGAPVARGLLDFIMPGVGKP